jgi:hypothetical protein
LLEPQLMAHSRLAMSPSVASDVPERISNGP